VARAKRTERTAARRRYRKATAAETTGPDDDVADVAIPAAARAERPRATQANPSTAVAPPTRSITDAFRGSIHRADVRGDLRAMPRIITRTPAVVLPVALIIATSILALLLGAQANILIVLAFQAFLIPPPLAVSFLGGILAPRAAWLVGGLVGLLSAVGFTFVMIAASDDVLRGLFRAAPGSPVPDGFREAYAFQAFLTAPLLGIAVGAFAGFYRRFLRVSRPARDQGRPQRRATAKR
jgi:hypothetical protein